MATAVELLAGIPSIIYGMWGLFVFGPFMAAHISPFINDYLGAVPVIGCCSRGRRWHRHADRRHSSWRS